MALFFFLGHKLRFLHKELNLVVEPPFDDVFALNDRDFKVKHHCETPVLCPSLHHSAPTHQNAPLGDIM